MTYRVKLSTRAKAAFQALTKRHQQLVGDRVLDLMSNPEGLGRPVVSPPFPPGGLMLEFSDEDPGEDHWYVFRIFYQINSLNQAVEISAIGHTEYNRDEEWPSGYSPL